MDDLQAIHVNGFGANFALSNAVSGVDENSVDDQGEQTDPTLEYTISATTINVGAGTGYAAGHDEDEPEGQLNQQNSVAAAMAQTRSDMETAPISNLQEAMPKTIALDVPLAKSWYTIIGGHFEGVQFGNDDHDIRQEQVKGYPNCRAHDFNPGTTDGVTATRLLR
eukprot:5430317-Pleurochrysis_carterae.AAC.9